MTRVLSLTVLFLACATPLQARATVYECRGPTGQRVAYADTSAACPSGSTAFAYVPPNICRTPGMCVEGPPPPDAVPVEFVCCAFVSGPEACVWVVSAAACPPDEYLATCDWGVSESDGSVTCYD
jgi:hypothetical protein